METMDVAKDPAVKMKGEDLAHAYDAVRVANKSVSTSIPFPSGVQSFRFTFTPFDLCLILVLCSGFWRASCVASAVSRRRS